MNTLRMAAAALLLASPLVSQDAKPAEVKDLTANLCVRGKLVFSEDFSKPELSKDWKVAKGKWEVVDGALKGSELASDMHAAVIKHAVPSKNLILQFSFNYEGAKGFSCSFDGKGHVCRVQLTPKGFQVVRNVEKGSGEKAPVLGKGEAALSDGWHTMLVEIQGREMLAQVDDKVFAFGENEGVDADKTTFGFPTQGESIRIKDVRLWEATPNPDWAASKQKLASGK
jgi:hypothetical protein